MKRPLPRAAQAPFILTRAMRGRPMSADLVARCLLWHRLPLSVQAVNQAGAPLGVAIEGVALAVVLRRRGWKPRKP